MTDAKLFEKYEKLKKYLAEKESLIVAFSGGVDSTFLLYAAHEALGDKALAVTAVSELFPEREKNESVEYCKSLGVKQLFIFPNELEIEGFSGNPKNRCYLCKKELFSTIKKLAENKGVAAVAEGSNLDDEGDYRPGLTAVAELGIISPLRELKFSKKEIRTLSKEFDIPTWNKPSCACLASRFPYGDNISSEKLTMVDKAEQLLFDLGFTQFRVRIHGRLARIEIKPEEFGKLLEKDVREKVYAGFKKNGFEYVSMDLLGYRTGSMNENL